MEEEKKRKKNKKKNKNKQNKANDTVTAGSGEGDSVDPHHLDVQNNHSNEVYENPKVEYEDVPKSDGDIDEHLIYETEGLVLAETEKQNWLNREATLGEAIKNLQTEKESYMQKEAGMEMRIVQLEREKESWLLNKASLEKKIGQLLDENEALSSQKANLEEKIEHLESEQNSWVLKENSTTEIIASMNDHKKRLQMQVAEVEEFKNNLCQENQFLKENISSLQSRIQSLESTCSTYSSTEIAKASENEDLNAQLEASHLLVENLAAENAELVEKMYDLHIKLGLHNAELASAVATEQEFNNVETLTITDITPEPNSITDTTPTPSPITDIAPETSLVTDIAPEPSEASEMTMEMIPIQNEMDIADIAPEQPSDKPGEIVQIPFDENEIQEMNFSQDDDDDEDIAVPITDAPLIGAPFRFISFFARYVSGADLVNKSSSNTEE